jgi:hypothetical protein
MGRSTYVPASWLDEMCGLLQRQLILLDNNDGASVTVKCVLEYPPDTKGKLTSSKQLVFLSEVYSKGKKRTVKKKSPTQGKYNCDLS